MKIFIRQIIIITVTITVLVGCKSNSQNGINTPDVDHIYLKVLSEKELDQVKVYLGQRFSTCIKFIHT